MDNTAHVAAGTVLNDKLGMLGLSPLYDYRVHPNLSDRIKKPKIFTLLGKPADAVKIAINNYNGGSLKFTIPPRELSGGVGTNYAVCIIDLNTGEVDDLADYCNEEICVILAFCYVFNHSLSASDFYMRKFFKKFQKNFDKQKSLLYNIKRLNFQGSKTKFAKKGMQITNFGKRIENRHLES